MAALDPVRIFQTLCKDLPQDLRKHIIVTGSLAAAYEYRVELQSHAVNTKDADLVVHPAGDVGSASEMARRLLELGWHRTDNCTPSNSRDPADQLRAIRLMPPSSTDYFIELLNVPEKEQVKTKVWIPLQLPDGWYGLPSFKFMGLMAWRPKSAEEGLEYAAPAMMALANLLSHPEVTDVKIESGIFEGLRRCAKDLGRVIALASLAGREATTEWIPQWRAGLEQCFPKTWSIHGRQTGNGLRQMLGDDGIMEQARQTTEVGLLNGKNYDITALRAFGERLLDDAIKDFEKEAVATANGCT